MSINKEIKDLHPDLEPITSAPTLFSFYGCGVKLYGNRDYSAESQSSVKTQYLSLFYVPLIPLKSYRVVKDGKQTYFLGKVPVSKTARKASLAVTTLGVLAVGGIGTQQYLSSESHKFGKTLAEAETAVSESRYADAMGLYKTVYDTSGKYRSQAEAAIGDIMSPTRLSSVSNVELAGVLSTYNAFGVPPRPQTQAAIYDLALDRVKTDIGEDDVSVHKLLHETESLNEEGEDLSAIDAALIESINKVDPENLEAAVELSQVAFAVGDLERVKQVLSPVEGELGDSEGARILAQTYIAENRYPEAYPLLSKYTTSRLEAFQKAETRFSKVSDELWDTEFFKLNNSLGPDSFYEEYNETPEPQQQVMVDTYISEIVFNKPKYLDALKLYQNAADIVPVAMDFGILQLRRAEGLSSPAEREAELTAAEETFLSIKNIAGDTDDYKIYLGQVYFWLGKQDLGQSLFEEVLTANDRAPQSLISISLTLRSLGKVGLAKDLAQEAYDNGPDPQSKYDAANILNLLSNTREERVKWLERADPDATYVKASLQENKGQLAAEKGDTKSAVRYLKEAIKLSESLPENGVTFNNTALVYFSLHDVTGDKDTFKSGVDLMSRAVELQSDDSILLGNAAEMMLTNSLYETLPDTLQFAKLKSRPSVSSTSWYYKNETERAALRTSLQGNSDFQKSVDYMVRSALLAPNNVDVYDSLSNVYYFTNDSEAMNKLVSEMKDNQIDISANQKRYFDYIEGTTAEADLKRMKEREVYLKTLLSDRGLNKSTRGALQSIVTSNIMGQVSYGDDTRIPDGVKMAQEAYGNLPSSRTQNGLYGALLAQASYEAGQNFPAYETYRDKWTKGYSDVSLIVFAMRNDADLLAWFKSNKTFQKAIAFNRENVERFPNNASPSRWALLNEIGDPSADKVAENYKASNIRQAWHKVSGITAPYAGNTIAEQVFVNNMNQKAGLSQERKESLEAMGVDVPDYILK